jgi:NAD(P)-dependent dehydrogenase (short-subunit alcohol dehydrogenase family)
MTSATSIVFGVGDVVGIGAATARRFAKEGHHVVLAGRTATKLQRVHDLITEAGGTATPLVCDVTDPASIDAAFDMAAQTGPLAAVIYNVGNNRYGPFLDIDPALFEAIWRDTTFGAFMVAQCAGRILSDQGQGSLFFTSATAAWRGRANFAAFAASKGATRNMAQAIAKELGPKGVHVATLIVDGIVYGDYVRSRAQSYLDSKGDDGSLDPEAIADAFWYLHTQPRNAWTHELDLRPFAEPF